MTPPLKASLDGFTYVRFFFHCWKGELHKCVLFVNELGISAHKFTDLTRDRTHDLASKIGSPNLSASWLALLL